MKYTQGKYQVLEKKALAKDIFSIVILCPEVAQLLFPDSLFTFFRRALL